MQGCSSLIHGAGVLQSMLLQQHFQHPPQLQAQLQAQEQHAQQQHTLQQIAQAQLAMFGQQEVPAHMVMQAAQQAQVDIHPEAASSTGLPLFQRPSCEH